MAYHYEVKSTRHSSERYGPCEVCGEHATEVFLQTETREFLYTEADGTKSVHHTHHGCTSRFGHKACLESQRRIEPALVAA